MNGTRWTDELDSTLRTMWGQGYSLVAIGRVVGKSKNAVAGRVHRLALTPRPSPIHRPAPLKPRKPRTRPAPKPPRQRVVKLAKGPSTYKTCQWIENEPTADDSCKCGAEAQPGSAYCARHHARCFTTSTGAEVA